MMPNALIARSVAALRMSSVSEKNCRSKPDGFN